MVGWCLGFGRGLPSALFTTIYTSEILHCCFFLSGCVNGVKNKYHHHHQQFFTILANPFSPCFASLCFTWLTKEGAQCGKIGHCIVDETKTHHRCESLVLLLAQCVSQRALSERHNIRLYTFDKVICSPFTLWIRHIAIPNQSFTV